MKRVNFFITVILTLLLSGNLHAADMNDKGMMGMDEDAMQEAMKKGSPGENHEALEVFAGEFTTTSRMWMEPGQPPQESSGTAEHDWVLGGRFLKMDVHGDMGGQPYEGIGYLGYDNIRGEYTAVWLDNMNTGMARATGEFDTESMTYTESGTFSCPLTGEKEMRFRGVWKIADDDTLTYTMYHPDPDGEDAKAMEVTYIRK